MAKKLILSEFKYSKKTLKVKKPLVWKVQENPKPPSVAEQRIIDCLSTTGLTFYREVIFNGMLTRKESYFRFDFWIPKYRLLLEYDGEHHLQPGNKAKDLYKDNFALWNNLKLHRFNKQHWSNLETEVLNTLQEVIRLSERNATYIKPS